MQVVIKVESDNAPVKTVWDGDLEFAPRKGDYVNFIKGCPSVRVDCVHFVVHRTPVEAVVTLKL